MTEDERNLVAGARTQIRNARRILSLMQRATWTMEEPKRSELREQIDGVDYALTLARAALVAVEDDNARSQAD